MELSDALAFARSNRQGVLVTQKRDGRPQLSNVMYAVDDEGVVRVSITADRAKYQNLRRDPRASLHVTQDDFWAYVVLEGDVDLSEVASAPDDATVDELVELYRSLSGEHPDWGDYRAAMARDRRLVVRLRPTHVYGMLPRT
ncbi:MAG: PPOX class F420-dependent oxidoreductase [Acidimicrobiia bacterium]